MSIAAIGVASFLNGMAFAQDKHPDVVACETYSTPFVENATLEDLERCRDQGKFGFDWGLDSNLDIFIAEAPLETVRAVLEKYGHQIPRVMIDDGYIPPKHTDPLNIAIQQDRIDVADLMIAHGFGATQASTLFEVSSPEMLSLLKRHGVDLTMRDQTGETALFHARSEELARAFIKAGVSISARDMDGNTALHRRPLAATIEAGAKVNARNKQGETPLHIHFLNGPVAELLIETGADVNARTNEGDTPLMYLAHGGMRIISDFVQSERGARIRALCAAGADPNIANNEGFTPLHAAAWNGWSAPIQALADCGADLGARTSDGRSAFDLLVASGKHEGTDVYWMLSDAQYE